VQHIDDLGTWDADLGRRKGAKDEEIVPWCGEHDHVWVTTDEDSRSRALRMGLLQSQGVAVIFVSPQPKGLQAQTELIVRHYPRWQERLGGEQPGYSAWHQPPNGALRRLSK